VEQPLKHESADALRSTHILIVEDNFLILMELESTLIEAGAEAIWTCRTVGEAMRVIADQNVDVAILDFQLDRENSVAVAHQLAGSGIPFCFYTGQLDADAVNVHWPDCRIISKPAERHKIVETVTALIANGAAR
jgi:DNA-binding response OmpR family regulator